MISFRYSDFDIEGNCTSRKSSDSYRGWARAVGSEQRHLLVITGHVSNPIDDVLQLFSIKYPFFPTTVTI
jgi:hypothetical protein